MSEDAAFAALLEFLNACEAGIAAAKRVIAEAKRVGQTSETWNPQHIKWEHAEGSRGIYERSDDVDNSDFKSLVKDLNQHDGKLAKDGYFFWLFKNGSTVGRKKR